MDDLFNFEGKVALVTAIATAQLCSCSTSRSMSTQEQCHLQRSRMHPALRQTESPHLLPCRADSLRGTSCAARSSAH